MPSTRPIPDGYVIIKFQGPTRDVIPFGLLKVMFSELSGGWSINTERDTVTFIYPERRRVHYLMRNIASIETVHNSKEYVDNWYAWLEQEHEEGKHRDTLVHGCNTCQLGVNRA